MKKKNIKTKFAEKVIVAAKNKAYHSVGRSIPWGVHEVEVPEALKMSITEHGKIK